MPTAEHELLPELIAERPRAILEIVHRLLDRELVPFEQIAGLAVVDGRVSQLVSPELASDRVVRVDKTDGSRASIIIEAQREIDRAKELTWPIYWATERRNIEGGVTYIVVAAYGRAVEAWARFVLSRVLPAEGRWIVIGPASARRIVDPELASREPEVAVVSALVHAGEPHDEDLVPAIASAISTLDSARGNIVHDLMLLRLGDAARALLEATMDSSKYVFKSDWALRHIEQGLEQGLEQGRVAGLVTALLAVIRARGWTSTTEQQTRIEACSDPEQLERWHERAIVAASLDDALA